MGDLPNTWSKSIEALKYSMPVTIQICRGNGKVKVENSKITWQTEDIQRLSFDNESFDTIISCETIEHVPIPKALSEIYRVLKPGGRFFLTCPNYFNLFGLWCVYRKIIGKPYTEGGQPYVNYILAPLIYGKLKR